MVMKEVCTGLHCVAHVLVYSVRLMFWSTVYMCGSCSGLQCMAHVLAYGTQYIDKQI